ncbi:hypothetical protein [Kiloniella sp.]|uniref:hypothetical protein n=1 Tax=Kiloniella sp. TaxID=1938587 RepID=UPI003B0115CF
MKRFATFVIDREMPEGEETISQLSSLLPYECSQVIAASVDNEIHRLELIENLLHSDWPPDEIVDCIRDVIIAPLSENQISKIQPQRES